MEHAPLALTTDLLDSISDGFVLLDGELRYRYANAATLRLIGKTREQIQGRFIWDIFPEYPPEAPFREPLDRAWREGVPTEVVGLSVHKGVWLDVQYYPYRDGLAIVFRDVTAQQHLTQALAESEARFRTMADAAPVMIWTADLDRRCSYLNQQWVRFTGRPREAQLDQGWIESVHPDDRDRCTEVFEAAFAARTPYVLESRLRHHDGAYRWVLDHGVPRFAPDGTFSGFIGAVVDVHDRHMEVLHRTFLDRASRVLSSSLDYDATLKRVADLAVPDIADWCSVLLVGEDGRPERVAVAHVDPAMLQWAKDYEARYPPDFEGENASAQVFRTGNPILINEITEAMIEAGVPDPEQRAQLIPLDMRAVLIVPVKTGERVLGVLSLIRTGESGRFEDEDLAFAQELATRAALAVENARLYHKATVAEARLREANEALEGRVQERTVQLEEAVQALGRSNRELQSFAQVASHDLQEPLRKVRAFAALLRQEYGDRLDEPGLHYVDRLQQAAARMSQFVADLLVYARVETDERSFSRVDLNDTLEAILSDLDVRLAETGGRVQAGPLPVVWADSMQMRQLLLNLVGNALKYRRPDVPPVVKVTAGEDAERVWLAVEDNGIGFDAKYAERIFVPFQRLHGRAQFEGTGMGLSIVRRIAERHGGTVTAEGTPGVGSRFVVSLMRR